MKKILVIDDDPELRELLRTALEEHGYIVYEAANGRSGECVFRSEHVDLVIMDIVMPEQDGLETIQNLRRDFPSARILATSGGFGGRYKNYLELSKRFGATEVIPKPFTMDEITRVIDTVLQAA